MTSGGHVALPEMRELLFADLPPLTALERFGAVEPVRSLAEAALRDDGAAAQVIADASGPLDGPSPSAPDQGYGRISVLTEAGIHAGSGPFGTLAANRLGGPVIGAAIDLMRLLIERSEDAPQA
jgi:hypothetical protein